MLQFKLVAVLMLASVAYFQTTDRPPWYYGCINTDECWDTQCCYLDGNRYSVAVCSPLLAEGSACRPGNSPHNLTVGYPNGDTVDLTNVYLHLCNCAAGLSCIQGICVRDALEVQPQQ